jgi:hypothetical protein
VVPDLSEADLSGMNLAAGGFRDANLTDVDLSGADLSRADLRHANLREAKLRGANLREADFGEANLVWANLQETDLQEADLSEARLYGSVLREAKLERATLLRTDLSSADLSGADLSGTRMGWTILGDIDLSTVTGLDTVDHVGPSVVGIEAIFHSEGKIPEVFLRRAGIPESFITYMRSLVGQPIQFFSCFISHSTRDKRFCDRLYADLQARGVRIWYFPEDARWGESVWGEIDRSIKVYDKLVVVCSENSLQSGPVLREIERALNREDREGKNILFPIRIDNYVFERWEHERKGDLLSKVIGDFRGWSRSAAKYERSLKRLVEALKAAEARPIAQASPGS